MSLGVPSPTALPWTGRPALNRALVMAAIGLAILGITAMRDPRQAAFSYLTAYAFALTTAIAALTLILIEALIAAEWFVAIRRLTESIACVLPALAILFVPILAAAPALYPWLDPAHRLDAQAQAVVQQKAAYLNWPFFVARAIGFLACWTALSEFIRRRSRREDREGGRSWTIAQRRLAGPAIILLAFTATFAAFDWLMSLSPTWFSTIYGVQVFAGGFVGALALIAVAAHALARRQPILVTPEHASAIGKLLLTFVMFWAYVSFSQVLIIWIANLPDEVSWYVPRLHGGWLAIAVAVLAGQFAIPFVLLLSYRRKRRLPSLARLGLSVLLIHYLEIYWLVMPEYRPDSAQPHLADFAGAALVLGVCAAWTAWQWDRAPAVPVGDPDVAVSLEYVET